MGLLSIIWFNCYERGFNIKKQILAGLTSCESFMASIEAFGVSYAVYFFVFAALISPNHNC
jgi:hypothetical protein